MPWRWHTISKATRNGVKSENEHTQRDNKASRICGAWCGDVCRPGRSIYKLCKRRGRVIFHPYAMAERMAQPVGATRWLGYDKLMVERDTWRGVTGALFHLWGPKLWLGRRWWSWRLNLSSSPPSLRSWTDFRDRLVVRIWKKFHTIVQTHNHFFPIYHFSTKTCLFGTP